MSHRIASKELPLTKRKTKGVYHPDLQRPSWLCKWNIPISSWEYSVTGCAIYVIIVRCPVYWTSFYSRCHSFKKCVSDGSWLLLALATVPGFVSYRFTEFGAIFIQVRMSTRLFLLLWLYIDLVIRRIRMKFCVASCTVITGVRKIVRCRSGCL